MRALLVLLLLGQIACCHAYPDRPLALILPFPATGSTDIAGIPRISKLLRIMQTVSAPSLTDNLVREMQHALTGALGQPVKLYRRTGGKMNAGTRYVAMAAADGYTLLFADNPTITIFPALNPSPSFDPLTDLMPVATFAHMPIAMIAASGHPAQTVNDIIGRAQRLPGSINYASTGDASTSHLTGELFRALSGAQIVHVNYNGSLPAINAVLTGQLELGFVPLPAVLPYLGGGKLRIIGMASSTRHPAVPDVPTIAEAGIAGFDASGWFGVFVPARTSSAIVSLLNYEINKALAAEPLQNMLVNQGLLAAPGSTEEFRALIEKDRARWPRLLKTVAVYP
jgi:tripartite-type tricarboxylate transporter receptor subunit TctC